MTKTAIDVLILLGINVLFVSILVISFRIKSSKKNYGPELAINHSIREHDSMGKKDFQIYLNNIFRYLFVIAVLLLLSLFGLAANTGGSFYQAVLLILMLVSSVLVFKKT